ncbi:MAG: hypothetical protein ACLTDM_15290 [Clostridium butyricum]
MKVKEFIENVNKEIAKRNEENSKNNNNFKVEAYEVTCIIDAELKKNIHEFELEEKIDSCKCCRVRESIKNGCCIGDKLYIWYKKKRISFASTFYNRKNYQLTIASVEVSDKPYLEKNLEDIISNYIDEQVSVKNSKEEKATKVKKLIEEKMTLDDFKEIYKMIKDSKYDYEYRNLLERKLGLYL